MKTVEQLIIERMEFDSEAHYVEWMEKCYLVLEELWELGFNTHELMKQLKEVRNHFDKFYGLEEREIVCQDAEQE